MFRLTASKVGSEMLTKATSHSSSFSFNRSGKRTFYYELRLVGPNSFPPPLLGKVT